MVSFLQHMFNMVGKLLYGPDHHVSMISANFPMTCNQILLTLSRKLKNESTCHVEINQNHGHVMVSYNNMIF